MNLFYQPHIPEGVFTLSEEESRHCVKVLRRRNGDELLVTDGQGFFYNTIITDANPKACAFTILNTTEEAKRRYKVHIALSPTKNTERVEWFIEKAVEIGIDTITFLDTDHGERSFLKMERLYKIAISAMKQSMKATLPTIQPLTSMKALVATASEDEKFIAYVDQQNTTHLVQAITPSRSVIVLIGPEGDFSKGELQFANEHHFKKVSLGASRLRTETAGLVACHSIHIVNT